MKVELTQDEMQTIANTLFEFCEQNNEQFTREEELEKIRNLYKKLYKSIKNNTHKN